MGSVFLIFISLAGWQQFFADTLKGYLPATTGFYAHFNLTASNEKIFSAPMEKILSAYNLNDLIQQNLINRELAVVELSDGGKWQYYLLLRTNDRIVLRKFLDQAGVSYKFLDDFHLVIGTGDLNIFAKNNLSIVKKNQHRFSPLIFANLYFSREFLSDYFSRGELTGYLSAIADNFKDQTGALFLNLKFSGGRLAITAKNQPRLTLTLSPTTNFGYDLFYHLKNFGQLAGLGQDWNNSLLQRIKLSFLADQTLALNQSFFKKISASDFTLALKQNPNTSGDSINDFSFQLFFNNRCEQFSASDGESLEKILSYFWAQENLQTRIISLSDGTAVKEKYFSPSEIVFQDDGQGNRVYQGADSRLKYRREKNQLIIFNSDVWRPLPQLTNNILIIKTAKIFSADLINYFQNFNLLILGIR